MEIKKENAEPQANVEKMTNEEEIRLQEKSKRTAEDIKKVFIETYGFAEDDEKLAKLVERELAHSKVVSKLIGQKIHWREKAGSGDGEKKEDKSLVVDENKNDIRSIERKKATERVLSKISDKFKDIDAESAFNKIKEVYREKEDDTLRGDFEKRLWQAFWLAYPDKYKENIREKAKKEETEHTADRSHSKLSGQKQKQVERKFFVKQTPVSDWFKKKS